MNASERRATAVLGSIFALRMLGLFMIVPVFSLYGSHYRGATPALLGLAVGIYGLAQALFQIPTSLLADRFPRKPIVAAGLLLFAGGGLIAAFSHSIWGVIAGRALAGSGAVSAVVMALLADVTREEQRTRAMSIMGISIALSFIIAFTVGPLVTSVIGLPGLFAITSAAGLGAMGLLVLVPTATRALPQNPLGWKTQLRFLLKHGDLNRLNLSILILHLLVTALFVLLPIQLKALGVSAAHQGWVYLPLLLGGFVAAVPAIVIAEKYRRMRRVFIGAVALIAVALVAQLVIAEWFGGSLAALLVGVGIFFIGFNVLEALLPSWISKVAPVASRASAMGLSATSQFFGAFLGGVLGGQLLHYIQSGGSVAATWGGLSVVGLLWFVATLRLTSPPYLSSLAVRLTHIPENTNGWLQQILHVNGVDDAVLLPSNHVVYLKINRHRFGEAERHKLSQLLSASVAIH